MSHTSIDPSCIGSDSDTILRQPPRLSTLQQNALRKLFNRAEFTPEEVAALGYRRLQKIEGVGEKGLLLILEWLKAHGHPVDAPTPGCDQGLSERNMRLLGRALRIVHAHGFATVPESREAGRLAKMLSQRKKE